MYPTITSTRLRAEDQCLLLGQVWVADLREDQAVLRGLVRTLPQQIPLKDVGGHCVQRPG